MMINQNSLLTGIDFNVCDIKSSIQKILLRLKLLETEEYTITNIPTKTIEEFEQLDKDVQKNEEALIRELIYVGGATLRQHILFILRKIFCRNVALLFSSKGKRGKKNFSATNCYKVVIKTIRSQYPAATEIEILQLISLHLASANDWEGGAKKRLSKLLHSNTTDSNDSIDIKCEYNR